MPASFVSGLTEVTAVGADHFMIFDATDSALKKSLVSDVLESATSISTSADATAITIDSSENVTFTNNVTINSGQLTAGGLAYPTSDGTNGQVLTTDGAGTLSFSTIQGYTDSDVETYLNTSEIYTDPTNNRIGIGTSSPARTLHTEGVGVLLANTGGTHEVLFGDNAYRYFGLYTPASPDYMSIRTGTTDLLTVTADGNVGIGTSSPTVPLQISHGSSSVGLYTLGGYNYQAKFESSDAEAAIVIEDSNSTNDGNRIGVITNDMTFTTAGTERLRIASNGDVQLQGGNQMTNALAWYNSNGPYELASIENVSHPSYNDSGGLLFKTAGLSNSGMAERMRIDSNGNVSIGSTSNPGYRLKVEGGGTTQLINRTGSDGALILFQNDGVGCGTIACSGSTTAYNTSSDYRLKEDEVPMTGATERVKALRPINFAWKLDGSRTDGFLAHEVQEIVPEAITGVKDAVDSEGNPDYQGIDQSKLVPLLVKTIQELEERITTLENA